MFISTDITWKRKPEMESKNIESIFIELIPTKAKSFIVGTLYRPPDTSDYLPKNWKELSHSTFLRFSCRIFNTNFSHMPSFALYCYWYELSEESFLKYYD